MKKKKIENAFIKTPVMKGGIKTMRKIIKENLVYPKEAIDHAIEGTVKLKYDIDYKGNIKKVIVTKGIGYGCDEEAIRLVHLFEFTVVKPRKNKVIFHKTIQINFQLPKSKEKPKPKQNQSIQYQYNISTKTVADKKSNPTPTYSYTISLPQKKD